MSGEDVDQLAERLAGRRRQLLAALWEECTAEMKTDLADLTRGGLRVRAVPESRLRRLERRGFVRREGKRIVFACGLMERFVERESAGVTSLQRVFGDAELFQQNVACSRGPPGAGSGRGQDTAWLRRAGHPTSAARAPSLDGLGQEYCGPGARSHLGARAQGRNHPAGIVDDCLAACRDPTPA